MLPKHDASKIYLYQFLTFGIYSLYWSARSGREVNQYLGQKAVPSAWWLVLPFGAFWWMWQYSQALAHLSAGKIKQTDIYLLFVLVSFVWEMALNTFQTVPDKIIKLFLPSTWALLISVVLVYAAVSLSLAFYCSFVQKKINHLAV